MNQYRVWPDGTVQDAADTPPSWMSDDYQLVEALSETDAASQVTGALQAGQVTFQIVTPGW